MKNKLADLGLLWLRVMLGLGSMYHGWTKVTGEGSIVGWSERSVAAMGFPLPVVWGFLAVGAELIGGFFILLGLWTRFAALAGAIVWLVAFFIRHQLDPFRVKELAAAYTVISIAILILGPGRFSVDGGKSGGRASSGAKKGKA